MPAASTSITESLAHMSPATYLALVVAVSVACQWVAWRTRIPSILLLLVVGFGVGQLVSGEQVLGHDILFDGIKLTVGIILFEGSLSLRLKQLRDLARPVRRLCSATVLLAWAMITVTAWLLGFDPRVALLIGAILVVTGPTVINPILRQLRPTLRISALLRWEGIVVDPIGTVLALLVFQAIVAGNAGAALPAVVVALAKTVVIAFGVGLSLGAVLTYLMRRRAIPDFLHGVVFLAAAVGAFVVSDVLQAESGLLTVTVLGIFLGNRPGLHLEHVAEFKEHLQVLFVGALFIVLGGRVAPTELAAVAPKALIFLAALVVLVRPISVLVGLARTSVTRAERTLLACMAPRGVVAAAVTSIFALSLQRSAARVAQEAATATGARGDALLAKADSLRAVGEQAGQIVPLVFLVIVCTVAIYGIGVNRLAERLGLASAKPQGVLFVGVTTWVVATARLLREAGIPVLVVARNAATLAPARAVGLDTLTANILSEFAVKDMDVAGIGYFVACTPEDEINATAAREFTRVFGGANTFQLHRDDATTRTGNERHDTAGHLSARFAFQPALSRAELDRRMTSGMTIERTRLTPEFTLADFLDRTGDDAVILFVQRSAGVVEVAHPDTKLPTDSGWLIAMVPDRQRAGHGAEPAVVNGRVVPATGLVHAPTSGTRRDADSAAPL